MPPEIEPAPAADFGALITAWAEREPSVHGLTLIGSRERAAGDTIWKADPQSDWDFQIITSRPKMFLNGAWAAGFPGAPLRAYAARQTRVGRVPKVNATFAGAEADFVIVPASTLRLAKVLVALGLHRRPGRVQRGLQDLAIVIRPGWRFLKGKREWDALYHKVVAEVGDPRLDNAEAQRLADGFVCDYIWTRRKLARGEGIAAQRMLHRELGEVNLRLLHELRLRRGERSFPEGRRLERIAGPAQLQQIAIDARCELPALRGATERAAATCQDLMRGLVGTAWSWPPTD